MQTAQEQVCHLAAILNISHFFLQKKNMNDKPILHFIYILDIEA